MSTINTTILSRKKTYSESGSLDFTPADEFIGLQPREVKPDVVTAAAAVAAAVGEYDGVEATSENLTLGGAVLFGSAGVALI